MERAILTPKRTEYGKSIRKEYESGEIKESRHNMTELEPRTDGISNTITTVQKDNLLIEQYDLVVVEMEERRLSNIYGFGGSNYAENVCDDKALSPTIRTYQGSSQQPMIVAMRGRNPDNPSDRTAGNPTEQRLEPNSQGICNTLTTVQKDNMVLEPKLIGGIGEKWGEKQYRQGNRVYDSDSIAMALTSQPLGNMGGNSYMYLTRESEYRIRKLTPKECWRLMDFLDEDFRKAEKVNSNSQLYRQAGNSIVRNVLIAIFGQMIPEKENMYKEL